MRAADIEALARAYLDDHPELYMEARERARRMGLIEPKDRDISKDDAVVFKVFELSQALARAT
jgi:hypothetical protein